MKKSNSQSQADDNTSPLNIKFFALLPHKGGKAGWTLERAREFCLKVQEYADKGLAPDCKAIASAMSKGDKKISEATCSGFLTELKKGAKDAQLSNKPFMLEAYMAKGRPFKQGNATAAEAKPKKK